ncbi:hypothetical protein PIB30_026851 [Stylosanthes scabra]|uniref:Uncharacterized protein n=1 Tax=Stylosanthes scabra TaxID=79078 RepID=A0ABU6SA41_9FABA|nr:hypothetical protein [Stylosanthes scabra]
MLSWNVSLSIAKDLFHRCSRNSGSSESAASRSGERPWKLVRGQSSKILDATYKVLNYLTHQFSTQG